MPNGFDRVVMNPPFERQQDIDHVSRAAGMLKPGGRLVSVMSAGVTFRENNKTRWFRDLIETFAGYERIDEALQRFEQHWAICRTRQRGQWCEACSQLELAAERDQRVAQLAASGRAS